MPRTVPVPQAAATEPQAEQQLPAAPGGAHPSTDVLQGAAQLQLRAAQRKVKRLNKQVLLLAAAYDAGRTITGLKRYAAAVAYRDAAKTEVLYWLARV